MSGKGSSGPRGSMWRCEAWFWLPAVGGCDTLCLFSRLLVYSFPDPNRDVTHELVNLSLRLADVDVGGARAPVFRIDCPYRSPAFDVDPGSVTRSNGHKSAPFVTIISPWCWLLLFRSGTGDGSGYGQPQRCTASDPVFGTACTIPRFLCAHSMALACSPAACSSQQSSWREGTCTTH